MYLNQVLYSQEVPPSKADIGECEAQPKSPGNNNFWNTPFETPQEQGTGQAQSGGKGKRQEKSPGNTNFWNVPFELPQGQETGQVQNGDKERRQTSGTTDLRLQSGPLSGEDRDLDGAIPYMQVVPPKWKRQWDESPHVEVGPPGPGGARNIIINKRQNQIAGPGTAATPAKEPRPLGERAQPDFNYVRPVHIGTNTGNRGADIPRVAIVNRRQSGNDSSNAPTPSNDPTGYLGELGANEAAAARAGAAIIPSHPGKRQSVGQSEFDSVAPHHDGNHKVDSPGTGSKL